MTTRREFFQYAAASSLAVVLSKELHRGKAQESLPNILLIVTDQSRQPRWFPDRLDKIMPNRARLERKGVSFTNYYVNAVPCAPSRASLLTGLYAQQHWILQNTHRFPLSLDPGFPTIGSMFKQLGYQTFYFGKWHLTNPKDWEEGIAPTEALRPYGFDQWLPQENSGVPNDIIGGVNEGYLEDAVITDAVVNMLIKQPVTETVGKPWLAVVSLINPHDIAWYPDGAKNFILSRKQDGTWVDYGLKLPANFETISQLRSNKPTAQIEYMNIWNEKTGLITRSNGSNWIEMLNYYLWLEAASDVHLGRIIDALESQPHNNNTVVLFTSDHGEMAGSHGLKGKASFMYEEQMNVPLILCDYTGRFVDRANAGTVRSQMASSVDIAPTLLSFVDPNNWSAQFSHLPGQNLQPFLHNPTWPDRSYVLATHDALWGGIRSPSHILSYRDRDWKLNLYHQWQPGTSNIILGDEQNEMYDLKTTQGFLELANIAASAPEKEQLRNNLLNSLLPKELRGALPGNLAEVQQRAENAYLSVVGRIPDNS